MDKKNIKRREILADLFSRNNALNGKYRIANLGFDNDDILYKDTFYLETLVIIANLFDKKIAQAETEGINTEDRTFIKEIGEEINFSITPVSRLQTILSGFFVLLKLTIFYAISIGFWGLFFGKGFLNFSFYGGLIGLLLGLWTAFVIFFQRTKQKIQDISFGAVLMLGGFALVIGVIGLLALIIKLAFF